MDILIIILGIIISIAGIIGCIVPMLPGPPLNFIALLLLYFFNISSLTNDYIISIGAVTLIITGLDYLLPTLWSKYFGVSKYGSWGAFLGMILGMVFFPPFGMFIGIFVGAVLGEMYFGQKNSVAMKSGIISMLLTISTIIIKLSLSGYITYIFILESF